MYDMNIDMPTLLYYKNLSNIGNRYSHLSYKPYGNVGLRTKSQVDVEHLHQCCSSSQQLVSPWQQNLVGKQTFFTNIFFISIYSSTGWLLGFWPVYRRPPSPLLLASWSRAKCQRCHLPNTFFRHISGFWWWQISMLIEWVNKLISIWLNSSIIFRNIPFSIYSPLAASSSVQNLDIIKLRRNAKRPVEKERILRLQ